MSGCRASTFINGKGAVLGRLGGAGQREPAARQRPSTSTTLRWFLFGLRGRAATAEPPLTSS